MAQMPRIAIVGPGNLGTALGLALRRAGFVIESVMGRPGSASLKKTRALAKKIGARAIRNAADASADLFWLCVPDSQIRAASRYLAGEHSWKGIVVLHSSGALASDELEPLRAKGAAVASAHPLMTFVGQAQPPFNGVPFAIEGDPIAVQLVREIVERLGGTPHSIRKTDKPAYHAWATFASPLLTILLATTEHIARLAGVPAKESRTRMIPILRQTVANYASLGAARAFSGPIIRGDAETVKQHLNALRKTPVAREVYRALVRASLEYLPAKNTAALAKTVDKS